MNAYNLGVHDAWAKFADVRMNMHGIPQIPPAVLAKPAAQMPAKPAAPQHPPLGFKAEATTPRVPSQPMANPENLWAQSAVAQGLSMPTLGRNVYAGLRAHLL